MCSTSSKNLFMHSLTVFQSSLMRNLIYSVVLLSWVLLKSSLCRRFSYISAKLQSVYWVESECLIAHFSQINFPLPVVSANGCSWTAECWNTTSPRNQGLLLFSSWWGMWSLPHDVLSHMTTSTTECSTFLDSITVVPLQRSTLF